MPDPFKRGSIFDPSVPKTVPASFRTDALDACGRATHVMQTGRTGGVLGWGGMQR